MRFLLLTKLANKQTQTHTNKIKSPNQEYKWLKSASYCFHNLSRGPSAAPGCPYGREEHTGKR